MKKENSQNTISAKKFVKLTVCLQSSNSLIVTVFAEKMFDFDMKRLVKDQCTEKF